jgi:hypothetical protein
MLQDKGHLAELEAFHRACRGEGPPMALEEMLEVSETSFAIPEQVAQGMPSRL